jgi:hypothetical protein
MPKYHVVSVSVMRITTTHEVTASSESEAEDLVDSDKGTFISTYEKYVDGDGWVTEVE